MAVLSGCRVPYTSYDDTDTAIPDAAPGGGCPEGAWDNFDNTLAPYLGGAEEEKVVVSIATDFHCPYCEEFALELIELYSKKEYQDHVRLYYHHHPLYMHPDSWEIHYAAAAIALQSNEKFWLLHDEVFIREYQDNRMTIEEVVTYADEVLKVDMEQFHADRASQEVIDFVVYEKQQAVDQGLTGTPSTWVCGIKVYWKDMGDVIDLFLEGGELDTGTEVDTATDSETDSSDGGL